MGASTHGNATDERSNIFSPDTNIFVMALLTLLFASSFIGNSLVIAVVYNNVNKKMRTTINLFVVNMAASDLLGIVFSFPILYLMALPSKDLSSPKKSTEPAILCKVFSALWLLSSGVSLLSLVAISFDRFWVVFFPTKQPFTGRKPSVVVTATWPFCIGFAIVPTFVVPSICAKPSIGFLSLYFALYLVFPTVAILVLYPAILIKLWYRRIPGNPSIANQELRNRTNRKVTILAAALTISFAFSWFPNAANTMKYLVKGKQSDYWSKKDEFLDKLVMLLSFSSCVWNPLICIVLNVNFRSGFKTMLGTFCSCFAVRNCCKPKNEVANLSSRAMDYGQEHNVIQLTSINNIKEN